MADILAAMIVAELKAGGSAFGEGAETLAHPLPDRLQSLKAISAAAGMKADALGRAVIDGNELTEIYQPGPRRS